MNTKTKFIVWIKEKRQQWEPNGDGPMTQKAAERIAKEIRQGCPGTLAKALPTGNDPRR